MQHTGSYDPTLVVLSIVIAALASYTALDLATRIRASAGWQRSLWLGSAAVAMGGGIWSMHFVGMLAFRIPGMDVGYDVSLTILSLALPIAVTAFGFFVAGWRSSPARLLFSGAVMGGGIAAMHYTGMAAMRMNAELSYRWEWVVLSVLIAIGAATVALPLAFRRTSVAERIVAALVMGLAVSGMHYAAMAGAIFTPAGGMFHATGLDGIGQTQLAVWVTATAIIILALGLLVATADRHFARIANREAAARHVTEKRFQLLVDSISDYAIYMLDPAGHVINWNTGAERIKGYSEEEALGVHFARFFTPEDQRRGEPEQALATAERLGRFESEGWRVRRDGSRFWASAVMNAIRDDAGKLIGFAKLTRDITERKQAQEALDKTREALAQAQKLEAIGKLTGGVAHDFNNLLMAVLGSLELVKKRLPEDPKTSRLVANAIEGANRGVALTQRMLAFARRQELKLEPVDIPILIHGMTELLKSSIGPENTIETRFPIDVPPVTADRNQLELALLNLAVNARDAMPKGGTIVIEARRADGSACGLQDGDFVCLSVTDTGHGMDEETLARAQEPFFTTKGTGKGTGLGLSMVRGLAEQSNGCFILKSRLDEGTTAEIWLPIATATQGDIAAPVPDTGPKHPEGTLDVLLVDDDPLVLENVAAMLEDVGHRVVSVRSGEEALSYLHGGWPVDLVLTDHAMPGMTGLELCEWVRAHRPGTKALMMSGYAELPSGAGATIPRLSKPFNQATLAAEIGRVMGSGSETAPLEKVSPI